MHRITRRWVVVTAVILTILLPTIQKLAFGDTQTPRVVLGPAAEDLVVGPGMNAAEHDLRGCEFVGQDLTGASFDGCNLYDVRIHQCILRQTSFRGAVFTGAEVTDIGAFGGPYSALQGADFTDATINGAERLYDLKLSPQQLMSTRSYKTKDLRKCAIWSLGQPKKLDFRQADLRQATLIGDFTKSDFTNARLYGATLQGVTLAFEQLASTLDFKQRGLHLRLSMARSSGLSEKWDFSRINLEGSHLLIPLPDADFTNARISGCTIHKGLTRAQLCSTASYRQGNLTGLRLTWSDLSGCDLSGMNLTGAAFAQCDFAEANLADAVITDVNFISVPSVSWGCKGLTADQIKSTWNYKRGRMDGIILPEEVARKLEEE